MLSVPDLSLVVLIGPDAAAFARRRFAPTQVLLGAAPGDVVERRLAAGRVTVVDGTDAPRAPLVALAKAHDVHAVAIVVGLAEPELGRTLKSLARDGFRRVHVLGTLAEEIVVEPLPCDRRADTGPFDVLGDVHGCRAELEELLRLLGYAIERDAGVPVGARHPMGRRAVFVGDLVDRGPDTPGVLRLVMGMVAAGAGLAVCGNHERKLVRALRGRNVRTSFGLAESLLQLDRQTQDFRTRVEEFCAGLVAHYVLDGGNLVVAHAGLPERYHGRESARVRGFALYGDTTGETDEYGLPIRLPWANDYRGHAMVLYGHTPILDPVWVNNTMCLDTGCVFGGRLTALRYPEREVVSVAAHRVWYEPVKPLGP